MKKFEIPIVLFFFRRTDGITRIIKRLSEIKPSKIYLISDGPKDKIQKEQVNSCRKIVENAINWDCEIIRNYAEENKGIYERIGCGAKWVLSREEKAIFLEDDNLPELSFFEYCKEMLELYEDNSKILWVCGTNYLEKYNPKDGSSYVFTQHLLPCGWASWSKKFLKYYDENLELFLDDSLVKRIKHEYSNKKLYKTQLYSIGNTKYKIDNYKQKASWDFQMCFALKVHGLYGISPKNNQITNIGVDEFSAHGGSSFKNVMVRRFCGMKSFPLEFPLNHPKSVLIDRDYEKKVGNIILPPLYLRIPTYFTKIIKKILKINIYESLGMGLKRKYGKYNKR